MESFEYDAAGQPGISRVRAHRTPEADYTFSWPYLNADAGVVVRRSIVSSRQAENYTLSWKDGAVTSICYEDSGGRCDVSRMHEYVRGPGFREAKCVRDSAGFFSRIERDDLGRTVAEYSGLAECDTVPDDTKARALRSGYLRATNRIAFEARRSVDLSSPAGFEAFTVWDTTAPGSAIDAQCGTAACQRPEAYNDASALTELVQRRIRVGRTLVSLEGSWGTQVQAETYGHDAKGRVVSVDGPRLEAADVTSYSWYPEGAAPGPWALEAVQGPGRQPARLLDYDALGHPHTITDEDGQTTRVDYDSLGRMKSSQLPLEAATQWSRLASGRVATMTAASGVAYKHTYDANGSLASIQRQSVTGTPDSETSWTRVDKQVTTQEELESGKVVRKTQFEYDNQGRLSLTRLPLGAPGPTTRGRYVSIDEDGRTTWMQEPLAGGVVKETEKSHAFKYDAPGNLIEVRQKMGTAWVATSTFTYDAHGNVASSTDSKGVTVRYRHDDFGRLVEVDGPDFGLYRYLYDEADNLVGQRRPDGTVTEYTYDASNRLTSVAVAGTAAEKYEYGTGTTAIADCAGGRLPAAATTGKLTHVHDASGDWYFGYWPSGRQRFKAHLRPQASCAKTLTWEYDAGGLLLAVRYPSGARVELEYPPAGQVLRDRPKALWLVAGGRRQALLSQVEWKAGELSRYVTAGGLEWRLERWQEGSPTSMALTKVSDGTAVVRSRYFGSGTFLGGPGSPAFDGWGNPLAIEEPWWTGFTQNFKSNDMPALVNASGPYGKLKVEYLASGDRHTADGQQYCYEAGTHRLASAGTTKYRYGPDGAMWKEEAADGTARTLCWDGRGRASSVVGRGGGVSRIVNNYLGQRVSEEWPLNGLKEDFLVDEASRLLLEEGVASLGAQYPRPVKEFVWLGMHPVAAVESTVDAAETATYQSVKYLHSGHLGEVLVETDSGGQAVWQFELTPFGARDAPESLKRPTGDFTKPYLETAHPYTSSSFRVDSAGGRAMRVLLTRVELASCDAITVTNAAGEVLGSFAGSVATLWTPWMPTDSVTVSLQAGGCGSGYGFNLLQSESELGATASESRSDATAHPYPAAGQRFRYSLGGGGYVHFTGVGLGSCDELEARDAAGTSLWRWKPAAGQTAGWTTKLVGDVDFGVWGQGCNGAEGKPGFAVVEVRRDAVSAPVAMGLPGQKYRYDGLVDNWNRYYQPELGRYAASEPKARDPGWVAKEGGEGSFLVSHAYARNNPLRLIDPTGLYSWAVQCDCEDEGKGGFLGITPLSPSTGDQCQDCWRARDYVAWICKNFPKSCKCAKKLEAQVCHGVARFSCPVPDPVPRRDDPVLTSR